MSGNPVEQQTLRDETEWVRSQATTLHYLFEGRTFNALRKLKEKQKKETAATVEREKIPETKQEMEKPVDRLERDETQTKPRPASPSPRRGQSDDDEARVRPRPTSLSTNRNQSNDDEAWVTLRRDSPRTGSPPLEDAMDQSLHTSSPKRSNVSDDGHMASDKAGNSNSSRRSPGDVTSPGNATQPGDETRNGSTRPTHACNPPAYLGDYVRKVNDTPKSWETVPNPVNPPGTLIKPLGTKGSDCLPWEPEHPRDETARLANFCAYFWSDTLDSTFYHECMLTLEYGRTDHRLGGSPNLLYKPML